MKNLARLTTTLGLFSVLLAATPALTQNQPTKPVLPRTLPNTTFSVQRQSGSCPKTVSLWSSSRWYEGGAENTVIADTLAIAGPVRLVSSGKKLVEYTAPLQKNYASCVGQAISQELAPYKFRFGNGNVSFRVELPPDPPGLPSEISARSIVDSRPYVRWALAD